MHTHTHTRLDQQLGRSIDTVTNIIGAMPIMLENCSDYFMHKSQKHRTLTWLEKKDYVLTISKMKTGSGRTMKYQVKNETGI